MAPFDGRGRREENSTEEDRGDDRGGPDEQTGDAFDARHVRDGRDHHDSGVRMLDSNLSEEPDPVHVRHMQVAEDQRRRAPNEALERFDPGPRLLTLEAVGLHDADQNAPQVWLVVDNQAARGGEGPSFW